MKACNQPHCGYQTPARTRKGNTDDHARDKHLGQICYWASIADDGGVTLCHTYAETAKQLLEHYMSKHVRPNIKKYWILQGGNRYMGYTCGWPGSPALHNKVPGRGDIGFTEPCRRIYKTRPSAERAARHRQFEIFCALHRGGWKAKHRKSLAAQEDVAPARKSDVAPAQKSEVAPAQMSDVAADEQAEAVEPNGQGDVSMRDVGEDSENEQGDVSMKDVGEDSNGESDGDQN
ncbi:hypothetical protein GGR50DRAFT_707074 [Xylaria sp. CBS 124048]|nr:hypothetical protein GGR50DRAFT_707074 [Xylaria sp. CBS 124048]